MFTNLRGIKKGEGKIDRSRIVTPPLQKQKREKKKTFDARRRRRNVGREFVSLPEKLLRRWDC